MFSQLCLTLFNPMDCSLPGSSIYGIFPASGLLFPTPWDPPNSVIEPSLTFPAFAGRLFTTSDTWEGALQPWKGNLLAPSCLIIFNPIDCSLPGSSLHGTLQVRILEWVAIPSLRGSSWFRDQTWISCIARGFFTIWTTREAPNVAITVINLVTVVFLPEKAMAPQSSTLAWKIPWAEEPGRLQSMTEVT